jgi:hypothetical protein
MLQTLKKFAAKWNPLIKSTRATLDCRLRSNALIFLTAVVATGCVSAPPSRSEAVHQGQWGTKILVHDKIKNKSATLSMDATSVWPDRLRLDVTGTLGVSVMSLALNKGQVTYVLPRQQKYFSGEVSDRVFSHIIHDLPLDPRWIIAILFDKPLRSEGWACSQPQLGSCENAASQIKVQVSNRTGERRLITITSPRLELKIQIQDFTGDIHPPDSLFSITRPDDFVDISNK